LTILITGATGHLGSLVIDALLTRGVPAADIRAGARSPEKITAVPAVRLDYTDAASIANAMTGVDTVLLISGTELGQRVEQHAAVIAAAVDAGVTHIVYTSAPAATTSPLLLAPEHKATEELIAASGLPSTILRNGWYTENYQSVLATASASGELVASVGDGRVSSASRKDYAEAAAVVLTEPGHNGQVYELSGDVAWSFDELAEAIATIAGRDVVYRRLSSEEHAAELTAAGLPDGTVGFIVGLDANIRDGLLGVTTGDLSRIIGRPTTPLVEGLPAA
jgi:NAD(P)H dehydrogenase (quinone)